MKFDLLQPDDIEVRVAKVTKVGCQLLLYKTARTDMLYLDNTVGPDRWKDEYVQVGNLVMCKLSIKTDSGEWITKMDTGEAAMSGSNAAKSLISDALKRAGTKWGIGRELYSSPFIWAKVPTKQVGQKWVLVDEYARFFVREISYDEKNRIKLLKITDAYGKLVYHSDKAKYPFAIIKNDVDKLEDVPAEIRQQVPEAEWTEETPNVPESTQSVRNVPAQPQAQQPQVQKVQAQPITKCQNCGAVIVPTKGKNGVVISPEQLMQIGMQRFGKCLCPNCIKQFSLKKQTA